MSKNSPERKLQVSEGLSARFRREWVQPVVSFSDGILTRLANRGSLTRIHGVESTSNSPALEYLERTLTIQLSTVVRELLQAQPAIIQVDETGKRKKKNSAESFEVLACLQEIQDLITRFADQNKQDVQVLAHCLEVAGAVIIAASEQVLSLDPRDKARYIRIYQRLISLYDWLIFRSPLIATLRSHHMEGEKDAGAVVAFRSHAVLDLLSLQDSLPLALTVSSGYAAQPMGGNRFPESAISCFTEKTAYLSPDMRNLITLLLRLHPLVLYGRGEVRDEATLRAMESGLCALIDTQEKLSGGLFAAELQKTQAYNTFFQLLIGLLPFFETNTIIRFAQLLVRDDGRFTKELYARWTALTPLLGSRSIMRPRVQFDAGGVGKIPMVAAMQSHAVALLVDKPLFTLDKPTSLVDVMTIVQLLISQRKIDIGRLKVNHSALYAAVEPNRTGSTEHGTLEDLYLRLVVGLENSFNRYFTADTGGKNYHETAAFCYMQLFFMIELLTPKTGQHEPTAFDAASPDHPKQVARQRLERLLVQVYQREQNEQVRETIVGAGLQHIFSYWHAEDIVALNAQYLTAAFEDPNRLLLRENAVFQWFFRLSTHSNTKFLHENRDRADKEEVVRANIALLEKVILSLPRLLGTTGSSKVSILATLAVGTPWENQLQNIGLQQSFGGVLQQAIAAFSTMEVLPLQANRERSSTIKALLAQVFDIILWTTGENESLKQEAIARCGGAIVSIIKSEITAFVPSSVPIDWDKLIEQERNRTQEWLDAELKHADTLSRQLQTQMSPVVAVLEQNQQQLFAYIVNLTETAARIQLPLPIVREVTQLREHMLQQSGAGYLPVVQPSEDNRNTPPPSALVLHHTQLKESTAYISGMLATIQESLAHTSSAVDEGFARVVGEALRFIQANHSMQTYTFSAEVTRFLTLVERRTMLAQSGESAVTQLMQAQVEFLRHQDRVRMAISLAAYQLSREFLPSEVSALLHPQTATTLTVVDNAV